MTPYSVTSLCDCKDAGFISIRPEDGKYEDDCVFCKKTYYLEVKPIPNGLAYYVYHK